MAETVGTIEEAVEVLRQAIVNAGGEMSYEDLLGVFPANVPPNSVVNAARAAFKFRLVANEHGGVDHIVSLS